MPPTFSPNDGLLEVAIAKQALTQLNLNAMYPKVCIKDYQPGAFERGDSVKIRRPKRRTATDLNPRSEEQNFAGFPFKEAEFFSGSLTLERLWTDGFMTYSIDSSQTVGLYVAETASQIADAIATPNDAYMYNKFRTFDIASTGTVRLGDTAPLAISACVKDGNLVPFNNEGLRGATVFLDKENVPQDKRYCILSSTAKGAFLGDAVVVNGFAAATIGSGQLIERGLKMGEFVERYGFLVSGCNSVGGQAGVNDLSTDTGLQADLPIAASVADNDFLYADLTGNVPVGAVKLTLTIAADKVIQNVAVGQIARIGTSGNAKAFGVILRIADADTIAPKVTLVPYAPDGSKLNPAEILTTDKFSIPSIPSVNTVNHVEALAMATRQIQEPSAGSGAVAASIVDPMSNLSIQVFSGNYSLAYVRQLNAAYMLTGAKITDFRKCGLILSL
jgi:hypothetical protein